MRNKRGFLQISFSWLFAIVAGVFILSFAIYGAVKFMDLGQTTSDVKIAKEIGILLNPLETGFETGKATFLTLPTESKINNKCDNTGVFGRQVIQVSQKNFGEWSDSDVDVAMRNKYLFSDKNVEGKKFYLFSKPFNFPFKVADLIYLTSSDKKYCFLGLDDDNLENIESELSTLKETQKNIILEDCPTSKDVIKVCFVTGVSSTSGCDIKVNTNLEYVENNGKIYFEGNDALMYAAIFADTEVYECQLKRLMQRTEQLSLIYKEKADFTGCGDNLKGDLVSISSSANDFIEDDESGSNIAFMAKLVGDIENKNDLAGCKLW